MSLRKIPNQEFQVLNWSVKAGSFQRSDRIDSVSVEVQTEDRKKRDFVFLVCLGMLDVITFSYTFLTSTKLMLAFFLSYLFHSNYLCHSQWIDSDCLYDNRVNHTKLVSESCFCCVHGTRIVRKEIKFRFLASNLLQIDFSYLITFIANICWAWTRRWRFIHFFVMPIVWTIAICACRLRCRQIRCWTWWWIQWTIGIR